MTEPAGERSEGLADIADVPDHPLHGGGETRPATFLTNFRRYVRGPSTARTVIVGDRP